MKNEIFEGLSYTEYAALEGVRHSRLRKFKLSPAHYRHAEMCQDEDTDALRLGRVTHTAALEPELFARKCIVWTEGRRAGKEWDTFARKNKHLDIVKPEEEEECKAIANAARLCPMAVPYLNGGKRELTLRWTDEETGIVCKARLDFVADIGAIVDLKTCRCAAPLEFGRSCANFDYHSQAAFYSDGYRACTGKELPYAVVPVEKAKPHVTQVYTLSEGDLDAGRHAYGLWLAKLKECREKGKWDGYAEGPIALSLPTWAAGANEDEDADTFGIVING